MLSVKVLAVDDHPSNLRLLDSMLGPEGYQVLKAESGLECLVIARQEHPDIILLDIMMPGVSGIDVCRELRSDPYFAAVPIILITAMSAREKLVDGLSAGADDFISKPVDRDELLARVKSLLRVKELYDALQDLNNHLDERVREQTSMIERLTHLKRYVSPEVAESIVAGRQETLAFHRARIAAVCCDLRDYTSFTLKACPEDVLVFLQQFYGTLGPMVMERQGTIDHFTGDGILALINDPVECEDPPYQAVKLAVALRREMTLLLEKWRQRGFHMGFGVGVTYGYATVGEVGFDQRREYSGIGPEINLANRLATLAHDGQVLISEPVFAEIAGKIESEPLPNQTLKGFSDPVTVYNVLTLRSETADRLQAPV